MTRDGVNNLEGIDDQSIWFRMVLVNTAQYRLQLFTLSISIDNNLPIKYKLLPESDVTFNVVTSDQRTIQLIFWQHTLTEDLPGILGVRKSLLVNQLSVLVSAFGLMA